MIKNKEEFTHIFKNPGNNYRSAPFWAWNDKLEDSQLCYQLDQMKEQKMGGAFIHSREGLETAYLSDEWMDKVETAVEHARDTELDIWIYDEDKWPSGMAGGMVTRECPQYRAKGMTMEVVRADWASLDPRSISGPEAGSVSETQETPVKIFLLREDNQGIYTYQAFSAPIEESVQDVEVLSGEANDKLLIYRIESSGSSEWYNGSAPADNLCPESVDKFLDLTHREYEKRFQREFGKTITGFFTDEPNVCDFFSEFTKNRPWIPWGRGFTEYFQTKNGYNILEHLPCLFYDCADKDGIGTSQVRHDYYKTLTERFSQSYFCQLHEWLNASNLKFTGHLLFENDLGYQSRTNGAVMPHYRHFDIPGIDLLGELDKEVLTVKQCTSVANQFGKDHVMSETYGCTKWDFGLEGQKWMGDWQFVMGVNIRCQHLALYSMKGLRKRDYPPIFSYQTTWWKYNHLLEDYFARFAACTTFGHVVREILVLHPQSSIWISSSSSETEDLSQMEGNMGWTDPHFQELNERGEEFNRFIRAVLGTHQDCDLGDETILEEAGKVTGSRLFVGNAGYSVVVIPPVTNLFSSTIRLLEEFAAQGGTVIAVGQAPSYADGRKTAEAGNLYNKDQVIHVNSLSEAITLLNAMDRKISLQNEFYTEDPAMLSMVRETEDTLLAVCVNHDQTKEHEILVTLCGIGSVEELSLMDGSSRRIQVQPDRRAGKTLFTQNFKKGESKVYLLHKGEQPDEQEARFSYRHPHASEAVLSCLPPAATFTRTMPNVLILDRCCYELSHEKSQVKALWKAQRAVREELGMRPVHQNGVQQRYLWAEQGHINDRTPLKLIFQFTISQLPDTGIYLGLEQSEYFEIQVNGVSCPNKKEGYYLDKDIHKILLGNLRTGVNELVLSCDYLERMELEDILLLGDFAVNQEREIIREPKKLHFGDWCFQGYPHHAGGMRYHFQTEGLLEKGERAELVVGSHGSAVTELFLNHQSAGIIPGAFADGVDITPYWNNGSNDLTIEVTAPPVNVFGPFHQTYDKCARSSSEDYRTEGIYETEEYVLKPYGLMEQIVIYRRSKIYEGNSPQ